MGQSQGSFQRCHICIDPVCDGRMDCDCSVCDKLDRCPRVLKPTIRITRKCTQKCSHCCFSCGPKREDMMSLETAGHIQAFLKANGIQAIDIMGGEFFCHPEWAEVMTLLVQGMESVRIVTNSDWAGHPDEAQKVVAFALAHKQCRFSLSYDRWHTNTHVAGAQALLGHHHIPFNTATKEQVTDESIVPVGQADLESVGFFAMFSCYCHNPVHKYSFLIDERGSIFKCGFGLWDYANVDEHLDGTFAARFKEFNTLFYNTYFSNCRACVRSFKSSGNQDQRKARRQDQAV